MRGIRGRLDILSPVVSLVLVSLVLVGYLLGQLSKLHLEMLVFLLK